MRYQNVCIEAVGYALPPHVITSSDLEDAIRPTLQRLGFPPGQIEQLSGVKERRFWDPGTRPSDVAAIAGERALERAGIPRDRVQCLVNTSVSRDHLEPATAALVAGKMGLSRSVMAFDVSNACLGFLNGMIAVANMIELGQIDVALVVDGESCREPVTHTLGRLGRPDTTMQDLRDNFATLTLGSGAAAAVLVRRDLSRTGHVLRGALGRSSPEHHTLCYGDVTGMTTDSQGLLVHGAALAAETWPMALEELGWEADQVDEFVCHQVSLVHFRHSFETVGLPLEKAMLTFPYLGNVGPASIPLTLALGESHGRIARGTDVCLYGVGSGLGCIVIGVTW